MARGSYLAFMLQGPVFIALAVMLRPIDLPGDAKAFLVATLGIAGSFFAWPLVTRTPLRRTLCGSRQERAPLGPARRVLGLGPRVSQCVMTGDTAFRHTSLEARVARFATAR